MDDVLVKVENVSKRFCGSLIRSFWYGLQDLGPGVQRLHHDWSGLPLICNCAGVCTAVQTQGGAQIVMAVGFPLSRQAAQPERIPRPPHPSNTRRHQAPHDLQPQPLAAATFCQLALAAPAPAACEHRPLVLKGLPKCPRPDPLAAARRRSLNLAAGPGSR